MRDHASVLHLDLDAFFAAVEQRDKPSLRGKPVVVGGVGGRGVVATASYEARKYGVRSAMSTREARSRCPHAAFLTGRFHAYREASGVVMGLLRAASPLVEPLSLDEAFVDLEAAGLPDLEVATVTAFAERLRADVADATGGLTASVGIGSSKFIAKVASDLDKPNGLFVVPPGTERELLRPMHVTVIPGVGPVTAERLRRVGIHTVAELESVSLDELVRLVGKSHGAGLYALARADDDRRVEPERETKSVSSEGTYDTDLTDRSLMEHLLTRQATDVATRLRKHGLSGRTVTIKVRMHDFTTLNRSTTLPSPTDSGATVAKLARGLLADLDTSGGVRLLGVGVSGLADWIQEDLFGETEDEEPEPSQQSEALQTEVTRARDRPGWAPGMDVVHDELGRGWVWGAGRGVVTVRFETAESPAGPVRSYADDDPALHPWRPPDETADETAGDVPAEYPVPADPSPGLASSLVDIRALDDAALADDALMRELYELSRRAELFGREDAPFWGFEEFLGAFRSDDSGERQEIFAAYAGDRLVGTAVLWSFLLDNVDKAWFRLNVDVPHRRRGIGRALLGRLEQAAKDDGRALIMGDARLPFDDREDHAYRRFAEACGYSLSNYEVVRHLAMPVPDEQIQAWVDEAAPRHQGYVIETFVDAMPEDLLESFCVLLGQLTVDAPTGAVDFEEEVVTPQRYAEMVATTNAMGRARYETVALTADRQVVAQSTLAMPRADSGHVYQWGTFVHREHRGHALGLATKAVNLRAVQAARPDLTLVSTQNGETNDFMVSINERMGFRPVEVSAEFIKHL